MPSNSLAAAVALGNTRSVPSSRNPNTSCGGGCCTGFYLRMANNTVADWTKRSWVTISQIRTLSVDRIGRRIAHASEEELARVVQGLNEILG